MSEPTRRPAGSLPIWTALADPYPAYRALRETEPVHWSEPLQVWVLSRYEDVAAAFRDPRFGSRRLALLLQQQLRGLDPASMHDYIDVFGHSVLMQDPPEHTRIRRVLNHGFLPGVVAGWAATIQRVVDELIDRVAAAGRMDAVADFAEPLPGIIIAELFGVPPDDQSRFYQWSNDLAIFFGGAFGGGHVEAAQRANEGARRLKEYFGEMLAQRKEDLRDDLLSHLLRGQSEGRLDEGELVAQCVFILAAGHITVIDQIANGIHTLLMHPEPASELRQDPMLVATTVDEIMRFEPAVPFMHRIAREDIPIRGRMIRKNQIVFLGIGPANHDPELFVDPERFDIRREDNKHLTLVVGPHHCLGARLAHLEIAAAMTTLLTRLPDVRLDSEHAPVRKSSLLFRGFQSLPITW